MLDGEPRAGDVQQRHGQGVRDDVMELAGDPVAFLGPGPLGQPGLSCPQLRGEVALVPDQQGRRDGQRGARHPGAPARIGIDPQPLDREEDHRASPVDHAAPTARSGERAPDADQADRKPADSGRVPVAEDRNPGGRHGRVRSR